MGKSGGKKKKQGAAAKSQSQSQSQSPPLDNDAALFIAMSHDLKDEGNRLFQTRDSEGALLKYEKALNLLPRNHIDVAYLRSNMAACYMHMGIADFPRAVHQCNLALEVSPKYTKALIKRARCYEGLNRLDLAFRDLNTVLDLEPNNLTALELGHRVEQAIQATAAGLPFHHPLPDSPKNDDHTSVNKTDDTEMVVDNKERNSKVEDLVVDKKAKDTIIIQDKLTDACEPKPTKNVKLVFGEDIRWAQLPENCSLFKLREVIQDRFPTSKAVFVKYKDEEGDMITITTNEELRWAESSAGAQASVRLYIVEVSPDRDPFYDKLRAADTDASRIADNGNVVKEVKDQGSLCIEDWIIQFAQLFKNYVGFSSDAYLDLHELGVKLYSEAMEETVSCDEAMLFFDMAAEKFQEMAALALFNWGNVHMARARKRIHFNEGSTHDTELDQVKDAYDWAQQEYEKAGKKYVEALKIKPNFYEAYLALSLQQFEQAKLSWYYTAASNVNLDTWSPTEVLDLYNKAEENIEKGMQLWEVLETQRQKSVKSPDNCLGQLQKMEFDRACEGISVTDSEEKAATIRTQINVLWGTMLYERSIMEFKLDLPVWHECLEVAVEKFELAGAPPTDITVMIKNHCSNDAALEGLGFRIDEIVQAWNDLDDAKRWYTGVPSFRLEPLLRRRVSKIYYALEHA